MQKKLLLLALSVALSACITNYQYRAPGKVAFEGGQARDAVLYWHKDEGRLWYGKRYEQHDSGLTMRICEVTPKAFTLGADNGLELLSKAGDAKVAELGPAGDPTPIPAQPVGEGVRCGAIVLDGKPANTAALGEGARPNAVFLCKNSARPERYPIAGEYSFGPVSRQESDALKAGPDPCTP